jgi:ParB-like chromosome segregation protein Spo0J
MSHRASDQRAAIGASGEYGDLAVHPIAELIPSMTAEEFDQLVDSVKADGLLHDIILSKDGTIILDGRHRYLACIEAGVEPTFRTLDHDLSEAEIPRFVVVENVHRRNLTVGQKAMIAAEIEAYHAQEAKAHQRGAGGGKGRAGGDVRTVGTNSSQPINRSAARAAADFGVGVTAVKQAKKLKQEAPDLAREVERGKLSLNEATKQHWAKPQVQSDPVPKPSQKTITLLTHEGVEVPYPEPKSKSTFNQTNDQVDWAKWTWNPVTGCLHGCSYCYAREMAEMMPSYRAAYPVGFTPLFHEERLDAPANTKVPAEAVTDRDGVDASCALWLTCMGSGYQTRR